MGRPKTVFFKIYGVGSKFLSNIKRLMISKDIKEERKDVGNVIPHAIYKENKEEEE